MIEEISQNGFTVKCMDGAEGMLALPDTTSVGDLVVDPWLGSGTTGAVALQLGRTFAGFDVIESYVLEAEEWLSQIRMG